MESKYELKRIDIKNHTCYCFDDIMKPRDIDSRNILLDVKIYNLWYFIQNLYGFKIIAYLAR